MMAARSVQLWKVVAPRGSRESSLGAIDLIVAAFRRIWLGFSRSGMDSRSRVVLLPVLSANLERSDSVSHVPSICRGQNRAGWSRGRTSQY
jgi:hypothetical protein